MATTHHSRQEGPPEMSLRRWTALLLPPVTALAVYAWAYWFYSSSGLPLSVGMAVGGAVTVAALIAYTALVRGVGCFFGVLLTALALFAVVTAAERVTPRAVAVDCEVTEATGGSREPGTDGPAVPGRSVLTLDCPGGHPAQITTAREYRAKDRVRVSHDPERRVSPKAEGEPAPWFIGVLALLMLAVSSVIARYDGGRTEAPTPRRRR
ncbi:hypothetical protein [Streptomyces sp. NPDC056600]|uniref:hypothetical protein n=1 Tax=Streptomyces sp. NPDC056600 TaxID=3345874 RepID=UPI0036CF71BD